MSWIRYWFISVLERMIAWFSPKEVHAEIAPTGTLSGNLTWIYDVSCNPPKWVTGVPFPPEMNQAMDLYPSIGDCGSVILAICVDSENGFEPFSYALLRYTGSAYAIMVTTSADDTIGSFAQSILRCMNSERITPIELDSIIQADPELGEALREEMKHAHSN